MKKKEIILVTHDELPHTDDISCIVLLSMLFEALGYNVRYVRTRDENILSFYKTIPNAIIFDVGGGALDHHKDNYTEGERMYSSIGKVWDKYKYKIMSTFKIDEISWNDIDKYLISYIDLTDNTGKMNPFNFAFNSVRAYYGSTTDEAIEKCIDYLRLVWISVLSAEARKTEDRIKFDQLPIIKLEGKIFKFNSSPEYISETRINGIDGYIYASDHGTFCVKQFVKGLLKKGLQKNEELGIVFTHQNGFMGEVDGLESVKYILA